MLLTSEVLAQNIPATHHLSVFTTPPKWANNLSSINLGDYYDYIIQDNPKEQIIGFLSFGEREIGIKPPYKSFLYISLNNNGIFLKHINSSTVGNNYTHTFLNGDIKVVLDFDGVRHSASGNGNGGVFKLFHKGKNIKTTKFWSSI